MKHSVFLNPLTWTSTYQGSKYPFNFVSTEAVGNGVISKSISSSLEVLVITSWHFPRHVKVVLIKQGLKEHEKLLSLHLWVSGRNVGRENKRVPDSVPIAPHLLATIYLGSCYYFTSPSTFVNFACTSSVSWVSKKVRTHIR